MFCTISWTDTVVRSSEPTGGAIEPEEGGEKNPSDEVAAWLQEVGKRRPRPRAPAESTEELLTHLERVSGTRIRSREDIDAFLSGVARKARERRAGGAFKNALLGALLVIAILQYYFIDVQLQILMQPSLTVFAPARYPGPARPQRISGTPGGAGVTRTRPPLEPRARRIAL